MSDPKEEPQLRDELDLKLTDEDAEEVRGGDGVMVSNVLKSQHDAQAGSIGNMK